MLYIATNAETCRFKTFLGRLLPKVQKHSLLTVVALSLLIGISSCSQRFIESIQNTTQTIQNTTQKIKQSLQKVQSFQSALVGKYQEEGISVEISSSMGEESIRAINVQFINTSFNKLTATERQKIARDVATFAKAYFALDKPEDSILVNFVELRNYVVLQYSWAIDYYNFRSSELN